MKIYPALFLLLLAATPAVARTLTSQVSEVDSIPRIRAQYPVPAEPGQLFYIERSSNSNTVVYALDRDDKGAVNGRAPVTAFWRWYNVDGAKKGLNFAERMMAYGVSNDGIRPGKPITFRVAALPERTMTLDLADPAHPHALIQMEGRSVILDYVYLEVVDGGLLPKVPSVDIFGTDQKTGKAVHEHIIQN